MKYRKLTTQKVQKIGRWSKMQSKNYNNDYNKKDIKEKLGNKKNY